MLSEEAKLEINKKLNSRDFFVGIDGKFFFKSSTDIIDLVLSNMTG